ICRRASCSASAWSAGAGRRRSRSWSGRCTRTRRSRKRSAKRRSPRWAGRCTSEPGPHVAAPGRGPGRRIGMPRNGAASFEGVVVVRAVPGFAEGGRMRWRVALLAVVTAVVAGCSDAAAGPTVSRSDGAGTYDLTVLKFDPAGAQLQERGLLPLLPPADRRELNVSPMANAAQLVFRDPATNFVTIAGATYRLREFGIEV